MHRAQTDSLYVCLNFFIVNFEYQFKNAFENLGTFEHNNFHKCTPLKNNHFWQEMIPRMTSITARMKIIILTGKHNASSNPAPKAVKTSPLGQLLCRDMKNHPPYIVLMRLPASITLYEISRFW